MVTWQQTLHLDVGDVQEFSKGAPVARIELTPSLHPLYQFCVNMEAREKGTFYFRDHSGDQYYISVYQNMTSHNLRFRSGHPTIEYIAFCPS